MIREILKNIPKRPVVIDVNDAINEWINGDCYICYQTSSYFGILSSISAGSRTQFGFVIFGGTPKDPKFVGNTPKESLEYAMNNNPSGKRKLFIMDNFADVVNIPVSKNV